MMMMKHELFDVRYSERLVEGASILYNEVAQVVE